MEFYRDVINGEPRPGPVAAGFGQDRYQWGWQYRGPTRDVWWRDSEGNAVYYAGNEGGAQTTAYFCYVLLLWPRRPGA
jgi:hypothetical protein